MSMQGLQHGFLRAAARLALAGFGALFVVLSGHAAHASFSTTYPGSGCQNDVSIDRHATVNGSAIKADAFGAPIHCPITKNTSGPNLGGDAITSVQIRFDFGATRGTATCSAFAMKALLNGSENAGSPSGPYPWAQKVTGSLAGTGAGGAPLSLSLSATSNYWRDWLYADIACALPAGASLVSYTVVENGFQQSSLIFAPEQCQASSENTGAYKFVGNAVEAVDNPGGSNFGLNCGFGTRRNTELEVVASPNLNSSTHYQTPGVYSTYLHPIGAYPTQNLFLPAFNYDTSTAATLLNVFSPSSGDTTVYAYRLAGDVALKINAGGPAVAPFAQDPTTGATISHANTIDLSAVANPAPAAVYQTGRLGNFTYNLGGFTAGLAHTVRLHFAETYWNTVGSRVFTVKINDVTVLSNFDIRAAAGAVNKAIDRAFTANAKADGSYKISLTTVKDNALLSGIEIF
jgi:hypothetical protein